MKVIDHFVYDGFRLPKCGEYYGYMRDLNYEIFESIIDFENSPQHIYKPVFKDEEPDEIGFDEWNW
jgi:hypothetical protein